ncbi:MAG: bifunctional 3,4-dihydroxy-2-butanone-4-phosphate synthase/GTP cyclohydrolase II [Candidatus Cloacimonetes bacterium]|nr:bifunctional 3,4-dihydroxy-2-butanone-4-phosphate synthase/GTP cyclohydrolase II [Candidatus Cloacimonadota bacterium]MCF7867956.1 bifunctional 3,4-dihydroxy-2-butanone-4-phosphate synthase/GTP cyclohydrolase II [Candidatus Cloacimonadota bacterium]MCF7883414.1 bifunctional 3,4-dihydroxy-2-butanone-4-phosphate synthase/GTP cyclohydrolase II [Candidatus Cloacimonadota bacterium]
MLNTIEEALEDLRNGKMVIVVDDENRENEGDLLMAAEFATPEAVNFMITHGKGLVCMPMLENDLNKLGLKQMVKENTDNQQTAFTISVDHKSNTTGISAFDRSETIRNLIHPESTENDFRRPGHIFPLQAKNGGVLERAGHTEAAIDLTKSAGLTPAGVICEIIKENGQMARLPDLIVFSQKWNLKLISIEDLIKFRKMPESSVKRETSEINLPIKWGNFKIVAFSSQDSREPHLALIKGNPERSENTVLCRIHSECLTGDLLGSLRCDCGDQLSRAMEKIERNGEGVLIYLRQEGRGIGLLNKLKAYELQDEGLDTVQANEALGFPPEMRSFKIAADILKDLEILQVELMTNNPLKIRELRDFGIVVERRSHEFDPTCCNSYYLQTKKEKMGHLLKKVSG